MTDSVEVERAASSLREAIDEASTGLIEREAFVELIVLAAVAGEHLLAIGPPGTAKSEGVRRVAKAIGGQTFEYLLGRFTEPNEIFGPIDLRKLREGQVETETTGMLPEAEVAFLDEVFLGSTAILNTLLSVLNERTFVRGHTRMRCPLRVCVGASNAIPDDPALAAFADRFLVHAYLTPLPDPRLEELLEAGWALADVDAVPPTARLGDIDTLSKAARTVDLSEVRPILAEAIRSLRAAGIELTDRRAVRAQRLIAAASLLAGRLQPGEADVWPLVYAVPTSAGQQLARDELRDLLSSTKNRSLMHAAEEASRGPAVRAQRLVAAGRALLDEGAGEREQSWVRKLEGVAREIDAGFATDAIPADLAAVRAEIVSKLRASEGP